MSKPLDPGDPCYFMLENGRKEKSETPNEFDWRSKPVVFKEGCYICEDEEFSLMGLPLCRDCPKCQGHISADGTVCDDCGFDERESLLNEGIKGC